MRDWEIDGLRYHVAEAGEGEPLVLLHGFTGSAATWQDCIAEFSKYYRVIAIDLPGHGRTDAPTAIERYQMERVAADLAALLDGLGATPAHWLGYSMGGRLVLYVAVNYLHLVRSLILESASPGLSTEAERQDRRWKDEALAERIERDGIPTFVAAWEELPLFATQKRLPSNIRVALREQRLRNSAAGLAGSLRGMGTGAQPSLWEQLGAIDRPTLLLAGALDDKFVTINHKMAAFIPNARLQVVPDAGHTVHLEQPKAFAAAVLEFLSS